MRHYSAKYPGMSDYQSGLSFGRFLFIISAFAIIFFLTGYEKITLNSLLRFTSFCSLGCCILLVFRVKSKTNIIIAKIERVLNENLDLVKKEGKYKEHLLLCNTKYDFYRNEKISSIAFIIAFIIYFILSKNKEIGNIKLFFLLFIIIPFMYYWIKKIFCFFYEVANSCSPMILKDKEYLKKISTENIKVDWGNYQKKWTHLSSIIALLIVLTSLSIFTSQTYQMLAKASLSLISLIILIAMAKDIDAIVKSNLLTVGEYDKYSKAKLEIKYVNAPPPPGSMEEGMAIVRGDYLYNPEIKLPDFKKMLNKIF
jgi:hypothetical protein